MAGYENNITLDSGFQFSFDSINPATAEDAEQALGKLRTKASDYLRAGPSYTERRTERGRRIKQDPEEFYTQYVSDYLTIPKDQFNYNGSAPTILRTQLSGLRTLGAKAWYLSDRYGKDNVVPIMVSGSEAILYRDPELDKGRWRFYDHMDVELADFAEVAAGESLPIMAGALAGLKGFVAGTATTTPIGGIALGATAATGAEAAVGATQDVIYRKSLGIPEDVDSDFFKRRMNEAKMNMAFNTLVPLAGKIPLKSLVARKGTAEATKEVEAVMSLIGKEPIRYQLQGANSLVRLSEIASKFPDSSAATFLADIRTAIDNKVMGEFGVEQLNNPAINELLEKSIRDMAQQMGADEKAFRQALTGIKSEKEAVQGIVTSEAKKDAAKEASQVFQQELNKKAKNIVGKDVSVEQVGTSFKQDMINHYVNTEARVSRMLDEAYDSLSDVFIPIEDIAGVLQKQKNQAILNADDEVISAIAPTGRTASGRAVRSLDDVLEEPMSFRQLNELLREVRTKAGFGAKEVTPTMGVYRQLSRDIEGIRDRALEMASQEGRDLFTTANRAFREEVLPLRNSEMLKHTKAPDGQSYKAAIDLAKEGNEFKGALPELNKYLVGGTELSQNALQSPAKIRAFLRATGDSFQSRQKLRQVWLSKRGIVAGQDIPVNAFKLTPQEKDIVAELWGKNVKGFNQRLEILRELGRFADTKDGFIEGLTAKTVNEILSESSMRTNKELMELGKREIDAKKSLDNLLSDRLFKMMGDGELPLPKSAATIETFSESLLQKTNPADFKRVVDRFREAGEGEEQALILGVLQFMTKKAGRNTDEAQVNIFGDSMWNPKEMRKVLDDNEVNLRELLGKERYDNFVQLNKGLERVSAFPNLPKATGVDELDIRLNVSGSGKVSGFVPNIYGAAKDRITKLMIYNQINNPIDFRFLVTPEDYARLNQATLKNLLVGTQLSSLLSEADVDPDFRLWLTENISSLQEQAGEYTVPSVNPAPQAQAAPVQ